jgi:3-hydroxybutyryl-CoA dehydrogenase
VTTVGLVGAGAMGAGIAQVAVEAGWEAVLHDVDPDAIDRARDRVAAGLARRASKLDLDADSVEAWVDGRLSMLRAAHTLDTLANEAVIVIEAVIEDLGLKQSIFRALDAETAPDVILATNTSALSVAAIASATSRPERVLGLHFFNPVPVMALVEVVAAAATATEVVDRATTIVTGWDKTPVRSADRPGFIVNRVNRPFTIEALRIVEEGAASVTGIDRAMRAAGYPMGPFELMDLAGLDVNLAAARAVWEGLGRPERLRPSPIQERLVEVGHLGRKTDAGFYRYQDGRRGEVIDDMGPVGRDTLDADRIRARIESAVAAEAVRAVEDGVASAVDVATALRLGASYPEQALQRLGRYPAQTGLPDARPALGVPDASSSEHRAPR